MAVKKVVRKNHSSKEMKRKILKVLLDPARHAKLVEHAAKKGAAEQNAMLKRYKESLK